MAIVSSFAENFKGIADAAVFDIAPLTFFIGPNSSGKSSCIHAIAALAQTIRVGKGRSHIVLDDENALVHLGRFIEVQHSKKYTDRMSLGLSLGTIVVKGIKQVSGEKIEELSLEGPVKVQYDFRSTKRTQDVYVSRALFALGDEQIEIAEKNGEYSAKFRGGVFPVTRGKNFFFSMSPASLSGSVPDAFTAFFVLNGIQGLLEKELGNTLYLGPFRQGPARRYPFRGTCPNEVGADGGATVSMLANEVIQSKKERMQPKLDFGWKK